MTRSARWTSVAERGSIAALRVMEHFQRWFGRRASLALLHPIVVYFLLRGTDTRRFSRSYLERVWADPAGRRALGRPPDLGTVYRHVLEFAISILDRMIVWAGGFSSFTMTHEGSERLFALAGERRGAILLGSHLGSFDMMRLLATRHRLVVNVLMFTANAEQINRFFERLDPTSAVRVIAFDPHSVRTAFEIRACLDRGEFVGILGDRLAPGGRERRLAVPFLGQPADFPLSPYLLAVTLGCPLLFSICLRTGDARYHARVMSLYDGPAVPRAEREKRAEELLRTYVAELETACLAAPLQWFNFFDFWPDAASPRATGGALA
jgi:predicted LPLAT superfamily acyltransferase